MVEATALVTHKSIDSDFLSFEEGDVLKITEMDVQIEDFSWYRAHLNGKQGLVADIMLDIKPYRWFWHGTMTRFDAEAKLLDDPTEEFLIRQTANGQFYLSYKSKTHENKIWHFEIEYNQSDVTFAFFDDWKDEKKLFFSLNELAHDIKISGMHMHVRWTPAPDEQDVINRRKERRAKWSPNI